MRRVPLALLMMVAICARFLFGTGQRGDILTLGGKKYAILTNPLERYLEQHPESRPKPEFVSTDLWRGYVASWEIHNAELVLTDVRVQVSFGDQEWDKRRSVLSEIFPGQREVFAEWFSGHIIVPTGKRVKYVHMGYASEYESYLIYRVKKGQVTKEWRASGRQFKKFRKDQFNLFKKTEKYRTAWFEDRNNPENADMSDRELEDFLFGIYSEEIMSMIGETIH